MKLALISTLTVLALANQAHAFCTPGDVSVLQTALAAAGDFTPMTEDDRQAAADEVKAEPLIFPMPRG